MSNGPRIPIVGGGTDRMRTTLHRERLLRLGDATVMVTGPRSDLTGRALPAEPAAGHLEPRPVVVAVRAARRRSRGVAASPREVPFLDVPERPRQGFEAAPRVIAAGPARETPLSGPDGKEAECHACRQ